MWLSCACHEPSSARWPPSLALIPSAAQAQTEDTIYESLSIPTVDGDRINVEVARPKGAADAPVILTYSPYNSLSEGTSPNLAYDELGQRYLPIGYARAVADVLGTRNSSGCWDYGGREEQQSGVDLVNALAAQPRSNGRVAMIGGSYDGTTANMVAARGVDAPGLAAIVPELAISRWHGYAYWGGVRYLGNSEKPTDEGFDTPLGFDYGIARTPPTQRTPQTLDAMNDRIHPCDGLEHTLQGYDTSPDYDGLWEEGDYRKDAGEFRASTLVVHGWQDYNVKQSEGLDLYEALPMSTRASADAPFKRLYLFQASHQSPSGRPHFDALLDEFFATTLRGEAPGPELATPVLTQGRTSAAPGDFRRRRHGRPRRKRPAARARALADGRDARRRRRPRGVVHRHGNHLRGGHPAGARRRDGLAHLPLRAARGTHADRRHTAAGALARRRPGSRPARPDARDIAPDGTVKPISRGFLNLRYRNGLRDEEAVPPDEPVSATVTFSPQDHTVEPGHRIGLVVAGSNVVWAVPDAPARTTTTVLGGSLALPTAPWGRRRTSTAAG